MSQTTPTIDEVDRCLRTLGMFFFTQPVPSDEMMECMVRLSSIFSNQLVRERKMKQCKIYDYLVNKSQNIRKTHSFVLVFSFS